MLCVFIYFTVIDLYSYDFNWLQCIYSILQVQWKQKVGKYCKFENVKGENYFGNSYGSNNNIQMEFVCD